MQAFLHRRRTWKKDQQQPTAAVMVERSFTWSQPARIEVWIGNSEPWKLPNMKRQSITPYSGSKPNMGAREPAIGTQKLKKPAPMRNTHQVYLAPYLTDSMEPGICDSASVQRLP